MTPRYLLARHIIPNPALKYHTTYHTTTSGDVVISQIASKNSDGGHQIQPGIIDRCMCYFVPPHVVCWNLLHRLKAELLGEVLRTDIISMGSDDEIAHTTHN